MNEKSSQSDWHQSDWQGVGESFKDLGRKLKVHADEAQNAIRETSAPLSGVGAQVGAVLKTGLAKFDETVSDPAIGTAARGAAGKFLDALKSQLGADQPVSSSEAHATPDDRAQSGDEQPEDTQDDPKAPAGT